MVAVLLILSLWVGPTALATAVAIRAEGRARLVYAWGAVLTALPPLAVEGLSVWDAVTHHDGVCRHAPDIAYPCSLAQHVLDALVPGGFGAVGLLLLSPGVVTWSVLILGGAVVVARPGQAGTG